jgi:hypothetical protein
MTKQTPPLIVAPKRIYDNYPYNVKPEDWPEGPEFCLRYDGEYWVESYYGYHILDYGHGVLDGWEMAQCD